MEGRESAHCPAGILRDYLEDELWTEFDEDEMGEADAWVADDEDVVIGRRPTTFC